MAIAEGLSHGAITLIERISSVVGLEYAAM